MMRLKSPFIKLLRSFAPVLLVMALFVSGCSSTKRLPEGAALFVGYGVTVHDEKDTSNRQAVLETELTATVRPKPNFSILGLRPKLWIYNAFYTEKEKGIKHWIQTKLGEPPVLLSMVDTNSINVIMNNRLHNRGYFNNTVESTTTIENKKATIQWDAYVGEPYRLRNIAYTLSDSMAILQDLEETKPESLLTPGSPYDLETLTAERVRIDATLKNKGYYYFSPDMLIFSADTTVGNRQVDMLMRLKNEAPQYAIQPYSIDDIYIMANYTLGDSLSTSDTLAYEGYQYIPNENYVKAKHLLQGVFVEPDSLYTREDHLLTISRLSALPAYKFVNIDYERDTTQNNRLDSFIYLTPAFKKSLRLEGRYVSKSNNFSGPGITASFQNRNAFKGSELLSVEFQGNFESQVGGRGTGTPPEGETTNTNLSSYELGAQATLTVPRIISPFNLTNLRTEFLPKTRIGLGFNFLNRVQYYQMNSFNAAYAYNWRPRQTITHDFTPINLQYVHLVDTSTTFNQILQENTYLQRSFANQFIIGSIYQFTFSTQMFTERTHQFFDNVSVDVSGNIINGIQSLIGSPPPTDAEPRTLLGQPYSQYVRLENDFRYYLKTGEESMIATRLIAGVGYSFGNASTLPYVKQFTIGGPNSIRAFRARSIGPGTYNADTADFSFFDQTGEIKLETNIEYRFPISGFFKGAVFVDVGNIWLVRETLDANGEIDREGGKFNAATFLNQTAIGTGFGLRVDIEFFVIRFDFGIPVRVPYGPAEDRFVLNKFRPAFSGENGIVLNIAIGYPF